MKYRDSDTLYLSHVVHYFRDIPASVVDKYSTSTPFYGHVHGKLCFGQGETGDYTGGELSGRLALDYMPLDNWAHHALAHNFEESGRALQVHIHHNNSVCLYVYVLLFMFLVSPM